MPTPTETAIAAIRASLDEIEAMAREEADLLDAEDGDTYAAALDMLHDDHHDDDNDEPSHTLPEHHFDAVRDLIIAIREDSGLIEYFTRTRG